VAVLAALAAMPLWAQWRLEGPVRQGALVRGYAEPGSVVRFQGRAVRVSAEGYFLIGFGRDAPSTAELVVIPPGGEAEPRLLQVEQRAYQEQRIDGLPPRKVEPGAEDLQRIRSEAALVAAARRRDTAETYFASDFIWPVQGIVTGIYGSRRILNGQPRRPHYGVDIAAAEGTPVKSPAPGVVALVHEDMFFSGGTLVIDHGHGLSSTLIHLHRILVEEGAVVTQGQVVAEVGATGRATGPHLDWRVNLFKARLDPELIAGPPPGR